MNTPVPEPGPQPIGDPMVIASEVDAALQAVDECDDSAAQLPVLESLHHRLAAALATIDRA